MNAPKMVSVSQNGGTYFHKDIALDPLNISQKSMGT